MSKADITNGFKPVGYRNTHLMREFQGSNPRATRFQCCCGMDHLYVMGDPDNIAIRVNIEEGFDSKGGRVEIHRENGLPMFGHLREDCPGAGAPLTCHGEYTWDGSMWSTVCRKREAV